MKNLKTRLLQLLTATALLGGVPAGFAAATYFPIFDPFTNATASGGSAYAAGTTLAGQTNALGSYWYAIDSTATAANSAFLSNAVMSYPGLPPGSGGNAVVLRNVVGPGARYFIATNASGFSAGTAGNPLFWYYSLVLTVTNLNNLASNGFGTYAMGFGDQGTIGPQTTQPGTVEARLYFQKVNSTQYNLGISKMGVATNYTGPFTTNQILFVVVDYEGTSLSGSSDIVRMWVNPDPSTYGNNASRPSETGNDTAGPNLTPYLSCFQMYNLSTSNANALYITDFRMGSNWSWATGGPYINQQPPAIANIGGGVLNLSVGALNNGSSNFYQWQFNGTNLSDGPSISGSGATVSGSLTANLTITNTTVLDAGLYDVVVTNAVGSVTSSNSSASAYTFPVITVQPSPTNVQFYAGGSNNLNLSLTTLGLPVITNYLFSNSTVVAIATNTSLTLTNLQTSANFHVIASNSFGTATSSVVTVSIVPAPTAPYPVAVLNDHPIVFLPLNEGNDDGLGNNGATAYDYLSGDNGIYTNANLGLPGYAEGLAAQYGYTPATDASTSAQFGVYANPDSYVGQIPNINFTSPNAAPSFSLEAWVNVNGNFQVAGASVINKGFGGGEQFTLDYFSTGWRFYVRNAFSTVTSAVGTNNIDTNWHHLVAVLDTPHTNITIYVDSLAQARTTFSPANGLFNSANPVAIGSRMSSVSSDFNDNFKGNIQNVAIYNYALTAAQVANHYNAAGTGTNATIPGNVTVEEGTTLTVPSVVTGTPPLTYTWSDSGTGLPLPGQTNATLSLSNILASDYNGHYFELTVSNAYGVGVSGQMYVNIDSGPPFSVVVNPSSNAIYAGSTATYTASAQGSEPFEYQWSTNGVIIASATNSAVNLTAPPSGTLAIVCVVSNAYAGSSPPSATASLTGIPAPTDIYGQRVLADGPVAFWRLDEPLNATTAYDYVGGHNALYMNATNDLPGFSPILYPSETASGFGFGFTANSMAEETNNSANGIPLIDFATAGNAEFSIEAWTQAPGQGTTGDILCKGYPNNTQFALDTGGGGGSFRFVVHNTADSIYVASSGTVLPDGTWHHMVGVCDQVNGSLYLYADGNLLNKAAVPAGSGLLAEPTFPVIIGAQEAQGGNTFTTGVANDAISQVAIYPYALSSNQVAAHFALGAAGFVKLSIQASGGTALISWPGTNGYLLQQTTGSHPINWTTVTNAVSFVSGSSQVQVSATNTTQFFRLQAQ